MAGFSPDGGLTWIGRASQSISVLNLHPRVVTAFSPSTIVSGNTVLVTQVSVRVTPLEMSAMAVMTGDLSVIVSGNVSSFCLSVWFCGSAFALCPLCGASACLSHLPMPSDPHSFRWWV